MLVVCVDECYEGGGYEEVGPGFGGGGVDGRYKLAEFEYSQQYLFFWDKLEKANCSILTKVGLMVDFLECMIDLADEPLDSRLVQHLLSSPIGDGGQFDMVIVFPRCTRL